MEPANHRIGEAEPSSISLERGKAESRDLGQTGVARIRAGGTALGSDPEFPLQSEIAQESFHVVSMNQESALVVDLDRLAQGTSAKQ
jgi:hypothetical protein